MSRSIDVAFELERELQLLRGRLADADGAEPLQVGDAVEVEDPLDELVGVLHLVDRLVVEVLAEPLVAPVVEHLGVDEVLVDRRELGGEHLVEQLDDLVVTSHGVAAYDSCSNGDTGVAADAPRVLLVEQSFQLRPATTAAGTRAASVGDLLDRLRRPQRWRHRRSGR